MTQPDLVDLGDIRARMRGWQAAHPRATLSEIEQELDRQFAAVRARMLAEVATSVAQDLGPCPDCGGRLVRRGERERTLTTTGDEALVLQRPYATCSRCGRGLFPPG
jgi:YgiT-type zinc finger domain-containing protein